MLKLTDSGIFLFVKIIPKASKNEIVGWENDRLKIRLAAIPDKGLANAALILFLSKVFSVSKSQVILVQGETSRLKKLLIKGLTVEEAVKKLGL